MIKSENANRILKDNPVFWSRLGFCYDPPIPDENGDPLVFDKNFEKYTRMHDKFSDCGIKIHTCILHSGWVGVNKYDYSLCDKVLDAIFKSGKTEWFIPRIKLNVPVDWCRQNPEDVFVYYEGPQTAQEISRYVGTQKQDWLGYESEVGYYNANGWQDTRPNVGGVISLQSFSSHKWLNDAGVALKNLIEHIESGPYADKILAYHIAYGACGESMPWGRQDGKFGDYGITNKKEFLKWGKDKYGSTLQAQKIWNDTKNQIVPPPQLRECDEFGKNCVWGIDYLEFMSQVNTNALNHFGKIAKDASNGKSVGAFYGYILHMSRSGYAGHIGWNTVLKSPYIDFFAAPKSYGRCGPGEPGGVMAPVVSINKYKLWVDECDNRTHLTSGDTNGNAETPEQTYAVHMRELCKNISYDSGLWYMDLGGGWLDDDGILENIKKLVKTSQSIRQTKHKSIAEILYVSDEPSLFYAPPQNIKDSESTMRNWQLAGAPIDYVLTEDLFEADLSNVKAMIFSSCYMYDEKIIQKLKELAPDCTFIWQGEKPKIQFECKNDVFVPLGITVKSARKILKDAKVHFYAPEQCAIYADNRMVSYFPKEDMEFVSQLKNVCSIKNISSGEITENQNTIKLSLKAKSGAMFEIIQ